MSNVDGDCMSPLESDDVFLFIWNQKQAKKRTAKSNFSKEKIFGLGVFVRRLLQRSFKMSGKIESKWQKNVRESTELQNCEFKNSPWYKKHHHCCARRRCNKKLKAFEIQATKTLTQA